VEIEDGHVRLREDGDHGPEAAADAAEGHTSKPSIDRLLRTAAEAYGEGLVAVILTGAGSDGAAGARSVKEAGGTVVIQNPETASYPSMPLSLAAATVDVVADLEAIGPLLRELIAAPSPPSAPEETRALRALLEQLRERSGIDFASYKTPTIMRRLQRRMVATGTRSIGDYARHLERAPDEYDRLVSSFLIKVTGFFRDADLYRQLRERIVPELVRGARERGNELRLWSAGCATGEEAYSLAILVADALGEELDRFTVRVFATDLDSDAIAFARHGVYPAAALASVPRDLAERHFTPLQTGEYEINKRVRALTVFGQHDLGQRAPFPRIDLALCRNVLIYFTTELQRRALQLFAFALREGGFLVLGKAETISPLAEYFSVADASLKVFRRQGNATVSIPATRIRDVTPILPLRPNAPPGGGGGVGGLARIAPGPGMLDAAGPRGLRPPLRARSSTERIEGLLMQLPVGVVVVDRRYDIHVINGAARRLLGIHTSAVGEDFVHLAQGVPASVVRQMIDDAFQAGGGAGVSDAVGGTREPAAAQVVRERAHHVVAAESAVGERRYLELTATPYRHEEHGEPLALVLVWEVTRVEGERVRLADEQRRMEADATRLTTQVARLSDSNHGLLAANQELAATNAALRSANEELLLSHEEAQAATEEVETLNEELQATNEEQETLNEELQATVEELNTTNDDLQARSAELQELAAVLEAEREQLRAVLSQMWEPVLVLDNAGQPVLTNAAFERLFGGAQGGAAAVFSSAGDGGRGIALEGPGGLAARAEPFQIDFARAGPDGRRRTFEAHGRPVTGPRGRQGCVITFRDVTDG
jgi:two-component system CheB/CheR fusion protein